KNIMEIMLAEKKQKEVDRLRKQFPMLSHKLNRKPIIYFDNAGTGHKPQTVLERLQKFYTDEYGKPKSEYQLGKRATEMVEEARPKVAGFIGAPSEKNSDFTRGC